MSYDGFRYLGKRTRFPRNWDYVTNESERRASTFALVATLFILSSVLWAQEPAKFFAFFLDKVSVNLQDDRL
jgi:hypothetical protein